jgi:hypothetical protein
MMYQVRWKLTAILNLNALTANAADPSSVRQAADFFDYALRRDPLNMGESRSGKARLWYWDVIGIYFIVDDEAMLVEVLLVGPARRH